jgi:hypothetical protein
MYMTNPKPADVSVEYLVSFHDEKFVHVAYNILLNRTPDPDGLAYYLSRVRSGISKIEILAQLRLSEEGKARNVSVSGLDKEIKRLKSSKIPLIGPVLKIFAGSAPGEDTQKNLRAIENKLNAIEENLKRSEAPVIETGVPISVDNTPVDARYNSIASRKHRFQVEKNKGSEQSVQENLAPNHAKSGLSANPLSKKFHDAMLDLHWYRSVYPTCNTKSEVVRHYEALAKSSLDIISPSPYFSLAFYSKTGVDTFVEQEKLYEHFIAEGCLEGRDPHPLFMSDWYRETYKLDSDVIPFVHYIEEGWQQGYRPHPAFWSDWYTDQYPGVWGDPLYHYLTEGWKKGCLPNPIFEPEWYKKESKATAAVLTDLFTDYLIRSPQELISPHPMFAPAYYAANCHNAGIHIPENIHSLTHFFMSGGAIDPHPLFDSSYYLSQGPTVAHSYPMVDFIISEPEYRDPNPFFSCHHYLLRRPDVASAGLNPLLHYLRSATSEPCFPHPLFDNGFYLNHYPDVAFSNVPPLTHYMLSGRFEGRICRPVQSPILSAQRKPLITPALISSKEISGNGAAKSSAATKGVFAHVFYPDLLNEVISASNNIPAPCTIFVTTDTPAKVRVIEEKSKSISIHPVEVRLVENRGRDIAPMIVGFADRLREVEFAVHIHTKKSLHYAKEFEAWRNYLINSNLGSKTIVANILSLFDNPDVGMVAPEDYGPISSLIQWGGNLQNVQALIGMMTDNELDISTETLLELPSGSMFWFRTKALAPLLDLTLQNYQFDPEAGQVDGTLAHAIERAFFYVGEIAGYGWVRFRVDNGSRAQSVPFECNMHVQRILPLRSKKSALVIKYPETRPFSPIVSLVQRPRLNLLIPSADLSKGYAGASEALRIFNGLKNTLKDRFDFRVISTDIPFSNQQHVEHSQSIVDLYRDHVDYQDVLCDGTRRALVPISVRQGDFFVASAWWTAHIARDMRKWQAETFDSVPKKFVYLIQDYESGFYPWSTQAMLAEATYLNAHDILPIFNTQILAEFFEEKGYFRKCLAYQPPMNEQIVAALDTECERENLVLIYMRPHALRNGIEFADALIQNVLRKDPDFWQSWKFIAIGEDFSAATVLQTGRISVHGRLSLSEYADYLSRARLGLSLMVSPHPSYPPLEMAGSGLLVLTNTYANKDLSSLHENLRSFDAFDLDRVGEQFRAMAEESLGDHAGRPLADWFFGGETNFSEVIRGASESILEMSNSVVPDRGSESPAVVQRQKLTVQ